MINEELIQLARKLSYTYSECDFDRTWLVVKEIVQWVAIHDAPGPTLGVDVGESVGTGERLS